MAIDRARQAVGEFDHLDALPRLVGLHHALPEPHGTLILPLLQCIPFAPERLHYQHAFRAVDAHLHCGCILLLSVVFFVQNHTLEVLRSDPATAVGLVGAGWVHDVLLTLYDVLLLYLATEDA